MQQSDTFTFTQCPPAFAQGGVHKQVKESTRSEVRRLQREYRENLEALRLEEELLGAS